MQGNSSNSGFIGSISIWPTENWQTDMKKAGGNPTNYLECNGQAVDSNKYPKLAKIMSHVPNYQGLFLRSRGGNAATIGQIQGDTIRNIFGSFSATTQKNIGNPFSTDAFYDYEIGTGDTGDESHELRRFVLMQVELFLPQVKIAQLTPP